jgi:hypothetical protein
MAMSSQTDCSAIKSEHHIDAHFSQSPQTTEPSEIIETDRIVAANRLLSKTKRDAIAAISAPIDYNDRHFHPAWTANNTQPVYNNNKAASHETNHLRHGIVETHIECAIGANRSRNMKPDTPIATQVPLNPHSTYRDTLSV